MGTGEEKKEVTDQILEEKAEAIPKKQVHRGEDRRHYREEGRDTKQEGTEGKDRRQHRGW